MAVRRKVVRCVLCGKIWPVKEAALKFVQPPRTGSLQWVCKDRHGTP